MGVYRRLLLSALSAVLLALCFPRFDLGFLIWIALVPLLIAIRGQGIRASFGYCFLTGILFFMGVFSWINVIEGFTLLDFLLLGIYLGSHIGIWGSLMSFTAKYTKIPCYIAAPALWVSMEYLRSNAGFLSLPWALLGHSQYLTIPVIQIASLIGVYGISFLIVMVNMLLGGIFMVLLEKKGWAPESGWRCLSKAQIVITIFFSASSCLYGYIALSAESVKEKVTIAIIQGNIPQDMRWDREYKELILAQHAGLTMRAANNDRPSLIVWPETSVPGVLSQDFRLMKTVTSFAAEAQTSLLIGAAQRPKFGDRDFRNTYRHNSAFFVSPEGVRQKQYKKIHLLPFGEYLPLAGKFPWPERIAASSGNFVPGSEYTLFTLDGNKFGVLICWESIFPDLFRQFVKNGARFIVNITNEAWFLDTAAPHQFLSMNVFRAVENRISVARSANTGISCFIDPHGRIIKRVEKEGKATFVDGYAAAEMPLSGERTFYSRYGDLFAFLCMAFGVLSVSYGIFQKLNKKRVNMPHA